VARPDTDEADDMGVVQSPLPRAVLRPSGPQPGAVQPRSTAGLPCHDVGEGAHLTNVWWVAAHGGAGEATLEQLLEGSRAAGHGWPITPAGVAPARVVLVARTNAGGLRAVQRASAQWAAGAIAVELVGLLLVADAPGRRPRPLRRLVEHVSGGVPVVWHLGWVEAWRVGDPVSIDTAPRAVVAVLGEVRAAISRASSANVVDAP
jgi:hypothetical protein